MELSVSIRKLVDKFSKEGFDFRTPKKIYNPIEFFLNRVTKKEYAHSLFIAHLLNPLGEHGQGVAFLNSFIKLIQGKRPTKSKLLFQHIDWNKTEVSTEHYIKTELPEYNDEERGRIDILLKCHDKNKKCKTCIIIENKLNGACYGKDQLTKYRKGIENEIKHKEILVVCLQINDRATDGADIILTPLEIAQFIENANPFEGKEVMPIIQSYTSYLKNLQMNNTALENAKTLVNTLTGKEVAEMRAIKEAYEQLPKAYAYEFMDILKEKFNIYENSDSNNSLKIEIDHYYPGYINIWNTSMKDYSDISRWFSVGFYHDEVRFYLVTNNLDQDKVKEYAHTVEFSFSSSSGGWSWYKSDTLYSSIKYSDDGEKTEVPDFEQIFRISMEYLRKLYIV